MSSKVSFLKGFSGKKLGNAKDTFILGFMIIIGIVITIIGFLSLNIYNSCPIGDRIKTQINYEISSFAIGLGVGILGFLFLNAIFKISPKVPLMLLAILLIAIASVNINYINKKFIPQLITFNTALIGAGVGLLLEFGSEFLDFVPYLELLQILSIILSIAIIVFTSTGINTYNKCNKPASTATDYYWLIGLLVFGILAIMLLIGSFFIG